MTGNKLFYSRCPSISKSSHLVLLHKHGFKILTFPPKEDSSLTFLIFTETQVYLILDSEFKYFLPCFLINQKSLCHNSTLIKIFKSSERKQGLCRFPVIPPNCQIAKFLTIRQMNLIHIWTEHFSLTAAIKFTHEKLFFS